MIAGFLTAARSPWAARRDCAPKQCAFPRIVNTKRPTYSTFTNVIVDPVTLGAAEEPQAGEAPDCVHAALSRLAGARRQALVDVCCVKARKKKTGRGEDADQETG